MSKVKSSNTNPEIEIRKYLRKNKVNPTRGKIDLPGRPDFIFPKYKSVLFVNGCFWHQHNCSRGKRIPKSNREYWRIKLEKNVKRDKKNQRKLRKMGWQVVKIWECQIKSESRLVKMLQGVLNDSGNVDT